MLERIEHDNGVVTYRSPLLHGVGVPHAFATRIGGISAGPYASLNLGPMTKDTAPDNNTSVAENFRRLRAAIGLQQHLRVTVRQVHGCGVWTPPVEPMRPDDAPEADAIVTTQPRQMLTIRTADCVPVLLSTRDGRAVAAVHAGWRGVVADVVARAVDQLIDRAPVTSSDILAAIGPCIGVEHFEVGPEVADAFNEAGLADTVRPVPDARPHIDLTAAVVTQLTRRGVPVEQIDTTDRCTYRDADEFFSHRRDRGVTGRMASVIAVAE